VKSGALGLRVLVIEVTADIGIMLLVNTGCGLVCGVVKRGPVIMAS